MNDSKKIQNNIRPAVNNLTKSLMKGVKNWQERLPVEFEYEVHKRLRNLLIEMRIIEDTEE